ncbi:class I SAM-dependent methyltransferase [Paraburkholderia sp. GAS33]|uniref:class I SAM-dependent methyltransferase n=1 Tax=Paraburkholderia sp. GAS33 TaxID=3035130 RepID=UPI003D1D14AD
MKTLDEQARQQTISCKICDSVSHLYGVVDFNKSCEESKGKFLPLTGIPVYYHQCSDCGLIFTAAFDQWSKQDFLDYIYNDSYTSIDPDYISVRPEENRLVIGQFCRSNKAVKILDYGGGNGHLSEIFSRDGYEARTWDPMETNAESSKPHGMKFDLVTAFEVMEHSPTPFETLSESTSFLKDDGVMFFSTFVVDTLPPRSAHFWYIAPRNGHVTIYTQRSLDILAERCRMRMHHINASHHLAYRSIPTWLR